MKRRMLWMCLAFSAAALLAVAGCAGDDDEGGGNPGHDKYLEGVMHAEGFTDPLVNCVGCHGAALRGGSGPSCYSCHNLADHTLVYSGQKHRPGANTLCAVCHGPNNKGGLGPACIRCH